MLSFISHLSWKLASYVSARSGSCLERKDGHWADLPEDILTLISSLLSTTDCAHMKAVCKSWSSIKLESTRGPWLMLPIEKGSEHVDFIDLPSGKKERIQLPRSLKGCCYWASSRGWFLMSQGSSKDPSVFLFDPIRRLQLPLPQVTLAPGYREYRGLGEEGDVGITYFLSSLALSSTDAPNCIVAAIFDHSATLALCVPGDSKWRLIRRRKGKNRYVNLQFSEGTLYVLVEKSYRRRKVSTVKIKGLGNYREIEVKLIPIYFPPVLEFKHITAHLLESGDELLIVYRWGDRDIYQQNSTPFLAFKIARTCVGRTEHVVLTEFKSLGEEQLLLLGRSESISVATRYVPGSRRIGIFFPVHDYMKFPNSICTCYPDDEKFERPDPGLYPEWRWESWFSPNLG